ncbi:hypothetical protein ACRAWD_29820 [Caulobacter segnis]
MTPQRNPDPERTPAEERRQGAFTPCPRSAMPQERRDRDRDRRAEAADINGDGEAGPGDDHLVVDLFKPGTTPDLDQRRSGAASPAETAKQAFSDPDDRGLSTPGTQLI